MGNKIHISSKEVQDMSEVECVKNLLPSYNNNHKTNFSEVEKNQIQDEIDVYCRDFLAREVLKVQVKKADPVFVGTHGRSTKQPLGARPLVTRNTTDVERRVLNNIEIVEDKYRLQGKDMSDIVLLLDEMLDPPDRVLEKIKSKILTSTFKEIWIVRRVGLPYKLY